jgi:hypothetical protein
MPTKIYLEKFSIYWSSVTPTLYLLYYIYFILYLCLLKQYIPQKVDYKNILYEPKVPVHLSDVGYRLEWKSRELLPCRKKKLFCDYLIAGW